MAGRRFPGWGSYKEGYALFPGRGFSGSSPRATACGKRGFRWSICKIDHLSPPVADARQKAVQKDLIGDVDWVRCQAVSASLGDIAAKSRLGQTLVGCLPNLCATAAATYPNCCKKNGSAEPTPHPTSLRSATAPGLPARPSLKACHWQPFQALWASSRRRLLGSLYNLKEITA